MASRFRFLRPTSCLGGFTLTELMISVSLLTLVSSVAMGAFIYTMRAAKAQRTTLLLADQSLQFQRKVKERATSAERFVLDQTLHIFQPDGTESELEFIDQDDNLNTIDNNFLRWDPDVDTGGDEEILIDYVTPLFETDEDGHEVQLPFFELQSGDLALRVRFRIGDRQNPTISTDDAVTGHGFQSYVVDTVFTPRNSVQP